MIWLNKTLLKRLRKLEEENKVLRREKYELFERLARISRVAESVREKARRRLSGGG